MPRRPSLLIFAATDGSGGAGAVADFRTAASFGCAPFAVVTGVTAQNFSAVQSFYKLPAAQVRRQFAAMDAPPAAVKIGVVGDVSAVAFCLRKIPATVPVVWDPVFAPTNGAAFATAADIGKMKKLFLANLPKIGGGDSAPAFAKTFVLTPNRKELFLLTNKSGDVPAAAAELCQSGATVCVTDADGRGAVRNILFCDGKAIWQKTTPRRRGNYHGSGCFFSTALAARLARGDALPQAAAFAHNKTLRAIDAADKNGGLLA